MALAVTVCVCSLALALGATDARGAAVRPTVTPATGGGGVAVVSGFTAFDPAVVGYEQSEVFLSGTASAYAITASASNDGKNSAVVTSTAPYMTRAVVMRPVKPRRFNGTVLVEWLNVSGGADAAADWMLGHNQLIREGFAWVGVSAQRVGLEALNQRIHRGEMRLATPTCHTPATTTRSTSSPRPRKPFVTTRPRSSED